MSFLDRAYLPTDSIEDRAFKKVLLIVVLISSVNISVLGYFTDFFGNPNAALCLYIFSAYVFLTLVFYLSTRLWISYMRLAIYGFLLFQASVQILAGGFASSGFFMAWGLPVIIGGVIVFDSNEKYLPFGMYLALIGGLVFFDNEIQASQLKMSSLGTLLMTANTFAWLGIMLFAMFSVYISALTREKKKSEELLLNILPAPIAKRLKNGEELIADSFQEVTVLFTDMVGFTAFAGKTEPRELVRILNEYFSIFDRLTLEMGIEKIKTIGDAYFAVSGLPEAREDHALVMTRFAKRLIEELHILNDKLNTDLELRVGMHSGPVVAGVIGTRKFTYDLWGDTVNIASRMESHGLKGAVHVSEASFQKLKDSFEFEAREPIQVKGKGLMQTYLLK